MMTSITPSNAQNARPEGYQTPPVTQPSSAVSTPALFARQERLDLLIERVASPALHDEVEAYREELDNFSLGDPAESTHSLG